ncbi:M23 family metallopeptidase [Thermaurantiacus sp.]
MRRGLGLPLHLAVLLAIALSPRAVAAQSPFDVTGSFTPGGLVRVRLPSGVTDLRLNGQPVPEAAPGTYLLGLGRDESGTARLSARAKDGTLLLREFPIAPRAFSIQRLPALGTTDTPAPEWVRQREVEIARVADAKRLAALRRQEASGWDEAFVRPVRGRVTGVYGSQRFYGGLPRSPHWGLDLAAPAGTPVRAPAAGIVRLADGPYLVEGNLVLLDHGAGLTSVYIHLDRIDVKAGDRVARGDVIGTVGTTGRSTGPHLHWGVSLLLPPEGQANPQEIRLDPALIASP